jgi:hypothetical protein
VGNFFHIRYTVINMGILVALAIGDYGKKSFIEAKG